MSDNERAMRDKAGEDGDSIVQEVRKCPDYFVMQGGSDGTFGHVEFWGLYGHLMPEISRLAVEYGGRV